ncbi:DUF927 domain-containing protein [Dysosmobacter sp.]|uniref:DUF927 domain-containing protein n=1 Tax=Dysosmobacter sp. TaxID=2591382 RepID=UPI003AAC9DE8
MASLDSVNLDQVVDYRAEYTAVIQKYKITGDNLVGLCPFHQDRNDSFSVDLKTGKWHCFAEDEGGNFVTFWAKYQGIDTKEAYKEILARYGITPEHERQAQSTNASGLGSYTLERYSFDKRLPADFLRDTCRVDTGRDRDGTEYLRMPYFFEDGKEAAIRKRYAKKEFRWMRGSKGKICLYGEWRLPGIRKAGYAVLVEGESDTQTLWYLGIPAIGIAGASMFKDYQTIGLQDLKLYIHKEPDGGGDTFYRKLTHALADTGFTGEVYVWSCQSLGKKDPSDVYLAHGKEEAAKLIREALKRAKAVDLEAEMREEPITGAPLSLRTPEGWLFSDKGISWIDPKTHTPANVCRTPILLTQRLKSLETGDEKMEVAFKRDGEWQRAIYPRSVIFSSRSITTLADLGCTITSENSKNVVKFLGALESENIDIIPKNDATSTFGWQPGRRFIPGHDEGITLDIDPSQRGMAAAYCQNGTMERWIEHMAPHRSREKFRFILAASFAAPLLRIVKQRIFFVYNWGGSKGGKTAALKAALSAWGDPERLMVNFNATQVGLERTAAFYCDLPLGIDERQLAGNNQGALEKIVYMIASGTGKIRGAKSGGIQTVHQWRTVALATGEEPLSTETSQTGVSTRVLEIYGGPFDNEQDAALMHQQAAMDCGWAGPAFIEHILQMDEREIVERYEDMQRYIRETSQGKNGSHIAGIAAVALADSLIDEWFFGGNPRESVAEAKLMAASILINQVEANTTDVNENAVQFIVDWVLANRSYFGANAIGTCLGFTSESGNTAYIFPSMLNQALTKAGYSPRKTMKYMAEKDLIGTDTDRKTGKKQYSIIKWFGTRSARFVEFHIGKLAENKDAIDDADEISDSDLPETWRQESFGGFREIEGTDEELPF